MKKDIDDRDNDEVCVELDEYGFGITEAPQNHPNNSSGRMKIIME